MSDFFIEFCLIFLFGRCNYSQTILQGTYGSFMPCENEHSFTGTYGSFMPCENEPPYKYYFLDNYSQTILIIIKPLMGIEPITLRLLSVCSNQMSYRGIYREPTVPLYEPSLSVSDLWSQLDAALCGIGGKSKQIQTNPPFTGTSLYMRLSTKCFYATIPPKCFMPLP